MKKTVDSITKGAMAVLMGSLVLCVVWQVISRYLLNAPSTFTDELARFLLIWVSLLGAAYLSGQNAHISIDMISQRLRPAAQRNLAIFINLLIILFVFSVLVIGGGKLVYTTFIYMQLTPTLQIPMAIVYMIGPIFGLLVTFYKLVNIRNLLSDSGTRSPETENTLNNPSHS